MNEPNIALSTLGSETVIKGSLITGPSTLDQRVYWLSFKGYITIDGLTPGEGALEVGVAHDDLTVAEIAEALDANDADADDIIARERRRRPVRQWGIFAGKDASEYLNNETSYDKSYKIRFSTGRDLEPAIWVRNHSLATLTTGAVVKVFGKLWGRKY